MDDGRIDLYVFDLEPADRRVAAMARLLSDDEAERAARFARAADRDRWTVSRGSLRRALSRYVGLEPARIHFAEGRNGKPVLGPGVAADPLHFNLSHSGGVGLLAVTRVAPVGADVEAERDIADRDRVAMRFFSPAEQAAYASVPAARRRRAFYDAWTRKEAVIKATGEGLSADLSAFDVTLLPGETACVLADRGPNRDAGQWRIFALRPRPGYVGAVALQTAQDVFIRRVDDAPDFGSPT